jgi:NAD-dependent dihydropyrimidine dehydrogenase PreA subunit
MKRAFTNFLVDGVIAVAFLVTAVSGVLFLLPKSWVVSSAGGTPTMLGVPTASWLSIHDWSGIVMMAGVLLHCALHWRWIVNMTRRTFGRAAARRAPARRAADSRPIVPQTVPAGTFLAASRREPHGGSARFTRAGFLKGAALVCGGLVAGGLASRGLAATAAGSTSAAAVTGTTATGQSTAQAASVTSQSASGTQAASNSAAQTATTVARVTVDGNACIGCGRCIGACPQGVFVASDGGATAADPAACVLCQRCLRACPANAITLNA